MTGRRILESANRILVRGVNWLGDAIMSTPALVRLRQAYPKAEITLLTYEKLADLWLRHPAVDRAMTFATGESVWSVSRKLKEQHFDAGIVLPNSPRSALELWLAGIPIRVGLRTPWRSWMLTQLIEPQGGPEMRKRSVSEIRRLAANAMQERETFPAHAHQLHHYLRIVGAVGASPEMIAPNILVTDDEVLAARAKFGLLREEYGIRPLLALNAGAEYGPAKRWPVERFIQTAEAVRKATKCVWIVCGGDGDRQLAGSITDEIQGRAGDVINVAGRTSLRELCAILKGSRLLLTNDTGPMHVAAAVGTPVIVPFGSTSPELTGPGLAGDPRHRLIVGQAACAPCFLRECPIDFRCMNSISVERVARAVVEVATAPCNQPPGV